MLWSDFLWAAKIQCVIPTATRAMETRHLYWQISDSRWNQACFLSHRQVFSLREGCAPAALCRLFEWHRCHCHSWWKGRWQITVHSRQNATLTIPVGMFSSLASCLFAKGRLLGQGVLHPRFFFAQYVERKLILPLEHVWLLLFFPLMLWIYVGMNTKMGYNFLSIYCYYRFAMLYYHSFLLLLTDSDYHKQGSVPKLLKDFKML